MRYYSTQRPVGPGCFPKPEGNKVLRIVNFDVKIYCKEVDCEAWGYVEYEQPLTNQEAKSWELTPEGTIWYPVTVSSRKHGGGIRVSSGQIIRAVQRPADKKGDTKKMEYKTRYFSTWEEAQRVMNVICNLKITTQGEVKVFINGEYILNFGDNIVLTKKDDCPDDYYGDDIGGWRSNAPDSGFVLGLIWHPYDYVYHHSDLICRKLGITPAEWIEA